MIHKYIDAIVNNNNKALAACFDEKCTYFDYCSVKGYHVYGSRAMDMYFHNQFTFRQFKIYDYVIEDDRHANFLVSYGQQYFHARATIESFSENGLIKEMTIRHA